MTHPDTDYKRKLVEIIDSNIQRLPHKPAYKMNGVSTTYQELGEKALHIASGLASQIHPANGKEVVRIGIQLPRYTHYIPCILAILKLGASYVPIDVNAPRERKRLIVSDSELDFLITEENLPQLLNADILGTLPYYETPVDEAYLIYTSGTTGVPKGVSQTPLTIYNYMLRATQPDDFNVSEESVVLHFASITFDVSVMEIFVSLFSGATLIIAQEEEKHDAVKLNDLMFSEGVTFAYLPPSLLALFQDFNLPALDTLAAGGEAIPHSLTQRIAGKYKFRFVNGYGPTESFYATTHVITHEDDWRCIGRPVPGVIGYVVDENLHQVGIGERGELLLGGNQLANGYWNRPELNEKSFIPNPFPETANVSPRLYHTGDFVIRNADGSFDYLGRMDSQVKLHGYRIELNEICVQIEKHQRVSRAFVQIEEINQEKYIVAYVITNDKDSHLADVREYLKEHLPPYSIPTFWNYMEEFPLNINGKIDKTRLVNKAWANLHGNTDVLTDRQQTLVNEVSAIFGLNDINIDVDLVEELGLTSIQAMRIPADLLAMGIYTTVEEIYQLRTIRKIADNYICPLSYWYNDPQGKTDKPVIIVISGYTSFSFLYKTWAEQLKDLYYIYVVETYHNILKEVVTSLEDLNTIYEELTHEVAEKYNVVAYTGFCLGGEQALYLAHKRYQNSEKKPYVVVVDGEVRRDTDPDHFIALNWPFFTTEQNRQRELVDLKLMETMPDFIYEGPVVSILSDKFAQQQTVMPDEQLTISEEKMNWYRIYFERTPRWWKEDYPDCELFTVPADHFSMLRTPESINPYVQYFRSLRSKL